MTTLELKPSQELLEAIQDLNQKYGESKELILKAYNLAIRDGFKPQQARQFLMAQIQFLSEGTIRKALPDEAKDQSKVRTNFATNKSQIPENKEDNTVNITTKHQIIDTPERKDVPSQGPYLEEPTEQQVYPSKQAEDEPSPLELAEIKIAQLEDALHKTEQFKPATVLEDDMNVIKFRCGIDAFDKAVKTNQVQAKSRGWKTVEITMRAV